MAKRRGRKPKTAKRAKKTKKSEISASTLSLGSGGHRHSYRWRYLQLIKDGLVWLTGKRTRSVRSESCLPPSKKRPVRRAYRKHNKGGSLRFKVARGGSKLRRKLSSKQRRGHSRSKMPGKGRGRSSLKALGRSAKGSGQHGSKGRRGRSARADKKNKRGAGRRGGSFMSDFLFVDPEFCGPKNLRKGKGAKRRGRKPGRHSRGPRHHKMGMVTRSSSRLPTGLSPTKNSTTPAPEKLPKVLMH